MASSTSNNRESFKAETLLPDARHEAFAQGIAKGQTLGVAYRGAGYAVASAAAARSNGCRLRGRPEVAARILHLRLKAAAQESGHVTRERKLEILSRLIYDTSLTASERLSAIKVHTDFMAADEGDRTPPDPTTVAAWLADDEEHRTLEHLARVLACLARMYHVTPERLAEVAAGCVGYEKREP
jgi:hypothetical protein